MKMILLSGGAGKRLWPLSNDNRSKQFIKVMDQDNPTLQLQPSMIQRVWSQLENNNLADHAVIAASLVQKEIIQSQLGDNIPLILEPVKRDTFPAISLASSYLYSKKLADENDVIVVMPVDVHADEGYYTSIRKLASEFESSTYNIGLMGLKPTHPSEKFGYIVTTHTQEATDQLLTIEKFIEKPTPTLASQLIDQGALWNCGVFAFRLGYMLRLLETWNLPTHYDHLFAKYHLMPSISFDYQVVENEANVGVLPYEGNWSDLGTWNEWTTTMPINLHGKGIISHECLNTHVINELQIPIVVMGISNAVIAASPDGILVTDKSMSSRLKDVIQQMDARPMYEETLYGWYRVIDMEYKESSKQALTKRVHVCSEKSIAYQVHLSRDEIWTIISGKADVVINGNKFQASTGEIIYIPAGSKHAIMALEDLDMIEVQIGSVISEDDIIKYDYQWSERTTWRKGRTTG
ncbi:sugar phosphate nucleotidyltransferase [Paenibacillus sp. N1-5-1-14]|uniref:sugar phosphate nucleotidyltransferase n=1 Tax=Paenibacillus radicibacter TaxID=2972488 RepID=UPI002159AB88|nr:sugar phosphate nucleotidyltransferase [Paenibacillus radicibacter]MCR8643478.1 sugar phosphate nucleotidyltransferase [Paenibacillus radicibacter]